MVRRWFNLFRTIGLDDEGGLKSINKDAFSNGCGDKGEVAEPEGSFPPQATKNRKVLKSAQLKSVKHFFKKCLVHFKKSAQHF